MTRARPVCVVGGSGQIGQRVAQAFAARGRRVIRTYYRHAIDGGEPLEASDAEQVLRLTQRLKPAVIVNSVNAQGGTDACEMDPDLARHAHFDTARHLADAARAVGAQMVQLSTDYVFDGRSGPYSETDAPAPLSRLGLAKLRAEQYALAHVPGALVLRTSFVFSWTPESSTKNFVMQLLDNDRHGRAMRVPNDQVGNVTYAPNLAEALVELVESGSVGLYHLAGTTRCSKYEWALRVADFFGLNRALIQGVSTDELGQVGPRPLQSGFRLEKAQAALRHTRLLSLEESLAAMEREMAPARIGTT